MMQARPKLILITLLSFGVVLSPALVLRIAPSQWWLQDKYEESSALIVPALTSLDTIHCRLSGSSPIPINLYSFFCIKSFPVSFRCRPFLFQISRALVAEAPCSDQS